MEKYINYYDNDNINIEFEFNEMTKEFAHRIQAYFLQDSHFIIYDEDILSKIKETKKEVDLNSPNMTGKFILTRDNNDKEHIIVKGTTIEKQSAEDSNAITKEYNCDIYEGLNFVSVNVVCQNSLENLCKFASINWFHDKIYNPHVLVRFNTKAREENNSNSNLDLEKEDLEYEVSEDFDISKDPTAIFKNNKKKIKVKKK